MSTPKLARLTPQTDATSEEFAHISSFGIVKQGNRILLAKMLKPERYAGKWVIPAFVINYGEHPEGAIKRLITNWLGTAPSTVSLLDVQSYGDKHWDLCFIYNVQLQSLGKLSQDIEKTEYFELSNLPSELRDDHREVLEGLMGRKLL